LIVCSLLVFIHLGGSLRRLISPHINLWRAGVPRRGNTATTVIMRREISITALIHRATLREHHTEITPTSTSDTMPPNRLTVLIGVQHDRVPRRIQQMPAKTTAELR